MNNKMKNTTIFEFSNEFVGFTTIPNYILNDNSISYKALGIYVQILQFQHSKEHKIYIEGLVKFKKDGRDSVRNALNELVKAGYIIKNQIRNAKGQLIGQKYKIFMKPCLNADEQTIQAEVGKSEIGKSEIGKSEIGKSNTKKENNKKENNKKENVVVAQHDTNNINIFLIEENTKLELTENQKKIISKWDIKRLGIAIEIFQSKDGEYFSLLHKIYREI